MTRDLPVLVVDGSRFDDLDGFARELSGLLSGYTWRGNLDALNDVLRGGYGTPDGGWVLRWVGSETSRTALGHPETARRLERLDSLVGAAPAWTARDGVLADALIG